MSILRMSPEQVAAHQARVKGGAAPKPPPAPKKRAKFGNVKVADEDGIVHDSKKEARRWRELGMSMRAGEIQALARQVRFALPGNTEYRADFVYGRVIDGTLAMTVEDTKSEPTRKIEAYRIKVRQMKAIYGIDIVEI